MSSLSEQVCSNLALVRSCLHKLKQHIKHGYDEKSASSPLQSIGYA